MFGHEEARAAAAVGVGRLGLSARVFSSSTVLQAARLHTSRIAQPQAITSASASGSAGPIKLGADLVELAVAAFLRALVAKRWFGIENFSGAGTASGRWRRGRGRRRGAFGS